MRTQTLLERLPAYAAELRLNFEALVVRQTLLSCEQLWGVLAASAMAGRCPSLLAAVLADAREVMLPEALAAAQKAAVMMTLSNGFYRGQALLDRATAAQMRAGLRVNSLRGRQAVAAEDFALWCLAVSLANGCHACVAAQQEMLRRLGSAPERTHVVLRLQALVAALAVVFAAEDVVER